jgi:Family of unknown function (DUF5678)
MTSQIVEKIEKKFKTAGLEPTSENIHDAVLAEVSSTQYHIISNFISHAMMSAAVHVLEDTKEGAVFIPEKDITVLFPAFPKLIESLEKLPENIDDEQRRIINEEIEKLSKTIARNNDEHAITERATIQKIPSSQIQEKTNLDWLLSNPPELEQYRGKYVAIENAKVIGSGKTSVEALAKARKDNPRRKVLLKLVSDSDIGI